MFTPFAIFTPFYKNCIFIQTINVGNCFKMFRIGKAIGV